MDGAVKFVSQNLATLSNFVKFRDSRNILRISRRRELELAIRAGLSGRVGPILGQGIVGPDRAGPD